MYQKHKLVLLGIIISFGLMGAGCARSSMQPISSDGPTAQESGLNINRVAVPALGFSYHTVYDNLDTKITGNRLNFGDPAVIGSDNVDFIERIERKPGQSFTDAIQVFAKAHGASDAKCTFKTEAVENTDHPFLSPGMEVGYVMPKSIPEATKSEIYAYLRTEKGGYVGATDKQLDELCQSAPECNWAAVSIYIARARQACGPYVNLGRPIISFFMNSKDSSDPILFLFSLEGRGGSVPSFYNGPIEFLK